MPTTYNISQFSGGADAVYGQGTTRIPVKKLYCGAGMDEFMVEAGTFFARRNDVFVNVYNVSEQGDRLIFPADFPYEKVLVRYYALPNLNEIEVPIVAREAVMTGILYYHYQFLAVNDRAEMQVKQQVLQKYAAIQFALIAELNRMTGAEWNKALAPKAVFPN